MTVQRTLEHYPESLYFNRHPDLYILEAVENLWLPEHDHDFVELVLVTEGKGTHYLNGEPLQAERGDLFAIPVGTRHIFRPEARVSRSSRGDRLKVLNCLIRKASLPRLSAFLEDERAAWFLSWLGGDMPGEHGMVGGGIGGDSTRFVNDVNGESRSRDSGAGERRAWLRVKDDSDELRRLFSRLYADYTGSADSLSLWSGALALLAAVYRHTALADGDPMTHAAPASSAASPGRNASADAPVRKALACMRARYAEPLTAAIVAEAAGIGERQLARLFASATGRSFRRHLEDIRVEACCRLLRDSHIAIMDLPPLVGYEQWKSLNRVFQDRIGVSLSEYRKQSRRTQAD